MRIEGKRVLLMAHDSLQYTNYPQTTLPRLFPVKSNLRRDPRPTEEGPTTIGFGSGGWRWHQGPWRWHQISKENWYG